MGSELAAGDDCISSICLHADNDVHLFYLFLHLIFDMGRMGQRRLINKNLRIAFGAEDTISPLFACSSFHLFRFVSIYSLSQETIVLPI